MLHNIELNAVILNRNKKRKNAKNKVKNNNKTAMIGFKNIKTTNILKEMEKISKSNIDIFPMFAVKCNGLKLYELSKYLSNKINTQIEVFQSVKGLTIIEQIAKSCVFYCLANNFVEIDLYIQNQYGFNNLYKKEIKVLPFILLNNLLNVLYRAVVDLQHMSEDICIGAHQNRFIFYKKYSLARIYGIAKYNQNLLKYIDISKNNVKKCVFKFIEKLNTYNKKIKLIFRQINYLLKYVNISGCELEI